MTEAVKLSDEGLNAMKALAAKATPGPWFAEINATSAWVGTPKGKGLGKKCDEVFFGEDLKDYRSEYVSRYVGRAEFIARCDPQTISSLIDEVLELRRASEDEERCIACDLPLLRGALVLHDASGGYIHASCCGPERESYTGEDGEPLKDGEPIPTGSPWVPDAELRLYQEVEFVANVAHPETMTGSHLTDASRAQLAFALIDNLKRRAAKALASYRSLPEDQL